MGNSEIYNQQNSGKMQRRNNFIFDVPFDVIQIICAFLKINEINHLATTSKEFYSAFYIHSKTQKFNHLIYGKSETNILYCSSNINPTFPSNKILYNLKLIRFSISTKDQGWVNDCESGSWVQANFVNYNTHQNGQIKQKIPLPLVYNYEVPDFVIKQKILDATDIPENNGKIDIYLRSTGEGWQIACKSIQVLYLYSSRLCLSQKQLIKERAMLKKKRRTSTTR